MDAALNGTIGTAPSEAVDPDAMLMVSVASGNQGAFEHLLLRYQGPAWELAWRMLGDASEARDVVQEAFLKIYRSASRYQPSASFRTYLFRVVTRLCLDVRSRKKPEYCGDPLNQFADQTASPQESLEDAERVEAVQRALACLPARQRAAIVLRYIEGLSYSEIAAACGTSQKAVDSLLQRARHALRRLLRDLT